jgi:hypothetical protein
MSAKKNIFDTKTIIYLLIVILIIAGIYIVVTSPQPEDQIQTYYPNEILENPQTQENLIGERIIIEGYYDTEHGIVSTPNDPLVGIALDDTQLDNKTSDLPLESNTKYEFTGILQRDPSPLSSSVLFIAEIADEV